MRGGRWCPPPTTRTAPLPPLLLALTVVTGLVDAFSHLVLGHVFVANMTGNVVFLGFALAGASGFSITASLVALGAFSLRALAGGAASKIGRRLLSTLAFLGGLVGALLVLRASAALAIAVASIVLIVVAVTAAIQSGDAIRYPGLAPSTRHPTLGARQRPAMGERERGDL